MTSERPLLGISVGDPGGIGPEITAKALAHEEIYRLCRPLVVADLRLMQEAVRIARVALQCREVESPRQGIYQHGTMDVLDMHNVDMEHLEYGKITAEGGKAAFEYIERIIQMALRGEIDACVTGPIHKEALNLAGIPFPGHTEIFANRTGTRDYAMMLVDGNFRVVHVSLHLSMREALDCVRRERVRKVIELAHQALIRMGIASPRLAVAGLNPHAGEGGLFGREEIEEISPAIEDARAEGIDVVGPIPPDTVFSRMAGGLYDAVVAMYHDQGHIALKVLGFSYDEQTKKARSVRGVNVTLGLPIIRTSVDHGVAFGSAGKGTASPQSRIDAITLAATMARKQYISR
jgi:4-hydroxythreonine-4-phosphate dehydrogenase